MVKKLLSRWRREIRLEAGMNPDAVLTKILVVILPLAVVFALITRSDECRATVQADSELHTSDVRSAPISQTC